MKQEITKELLENLLGQGFSTHQIGKQLGYSSKGIQYHMKKYDLQSSHNSIQDKLKTPIIDGKKQCGKCNEMKDISNYSVRLNGKLQSYCESCVNENKHSLLKRRKIQLVQEFGGCCSICGYNKNYSALEFHHTESESKDFHLGNAHTTNLNKLREEVEKCILVCSNCHKEIHYPQNNIN